MFPDSDIIVAPATLSGGALAVVRLSGEGSIALTDGLFRSVRSDAVGGELVDAAGYTLHYGYIVDGEEVVDDVMVSLFRAPHSYTGEESVEISCHGSSYIVGRIIELAVSRGARMAREGEFSVRAFLAGKMDLSQAEAVADMIASSSRAMHALATTQMRGGYSAKLSDLRARLVHLSALLELELDFSDEDVEFADRGELQRLMEELSAEITKLCESFRVGNAIKEGVAVAIVGAPNAGKSTLLNRLLGEDRAMVSDVAGTTRDTIEDVIVVDGVKYRFIDTAGLRESGDKLENMGMERTQAAISKARIVLQIIDIADDNEAEVSTTPEQTLIKVYNKVDTISSSSRSDAEGVFISAKSGEGVSDLLHRIKSSIDLDSLYGGDIIVSNARHHAHLKAAKESLSAAQKALSTHLPTDLLTEDLRHTLHEIGSITGEITNHEILGKIFSSFCIGK